MKIKVANWIKYLISPGVLSPNARYCIYQINKGRSFLQNSIEGREFLYAFDEFFEGENFSFRNYENYLEDIFGKERPHFWAGYNSKSRGLFEGFVERRAYKEAKRKCEYAGSLSLANYDNLEGIISLSEE